MTSFNLNFFSNQIQCSHVFLLIKFPESSLKQSYFIADETRDFPCIPVLPENFQIAPPVFLSALVGDSIRKSSIMSDTLDNCQENIQSSQVSPKRDTLFRKIKAEIAPESIGFRILCPTRWRVRGNCLQSIYENYEVLCTLWDECLQGRKTTRH